MAVLRRLNDVLESTALAAVVLRFLADGPRHGATQVCDSTHCAWFVGRGPGISWPSPGTPVLFARGSAEARDAAPFEAEPWDAIVRSARLVIDTRNATRGVTEHREKIILC